MTAVLAGVAAALLAAFGWRLLAAAFEQPTFLRTNVRGSLVPTGAGVLVVLAALAVEAVLGFFDALSQAVDLDGGFGRWLTLLVALGLSLLGLLDDVAGGADARGFGGHLRALARGRLTTGAVKLLGGAGLAVVAVAPLREGEPGWLLVDAALVALAANLANLLDRAPGRTTKVALLALVVLLALAGAQPQLAMVAAVVGGAVGLLVPDLRERLMLGDAGANPVGGVLGLGVVLVASPGVRLAALVVVGGLNLLSERVSFSRVIDRVPPLRYLDRLGRLP